MTVEHEGPPSPADAGSQVYGLIVDGRLSAAESLASIMAEWWYAQLGGSDHSWALIQAAMFNGMAHAIRATILMQEHQRERRKSRSRHEN